AANAGTRMTLRHEEIRVLAESLKGREASVILRLTAAEASQIASGAAPSIQAEFVEVEIDRDALDISGALRDRFPGAVFSAVIAVDAGDADARLRPGDSLRRCVESLLPGCFDILCLASDFDAAKGYYPTTDVLPAVHRFLVDIKERHRFSLVAAGGIRSAADSQKTIQRGANAIKIDWPVLLAADPMARQRFLRGEAPLPVADAAALTRRITNLIRVWNVQIIEVLGASGFKDIKKTVGEENRLLIFDDLEERVYDIFKNASRLARNRQANRDRIGREGEGKGWRYTELEKMSVPSALPHSFYKCSLPEGCYRVFDRDYVWPASLIETVGRMAAGEKETFFLGKVAETGNLGDGFDRIRVRFPSDPDGIPAEELDGVSTSLRLSGSLCLRTPFMGAGMSVGSIGPGTWRARVLASRALETQLDTGEGGYPTVFLLDKNWNPVDLADEQVLLLKPLMEERKLVAVQHLLEKADREIARKPGYAELRAALSKLPPSQQVQYVPIVEPEDEVFISTEMKTGLFGVTKETLRKAPRVVIAYSQGAKQGVGGHLLGRKVFGLVSRLRGVGEGISLISPFPFHNCYSIEDVKAFIDAVRMINPRTTVCVKVSPSPDIEFIVSGLARIAKDNRMVIEVWLDGPRGGTGAAPDIIKGQMGMHMEYAVPICHEKLMDDGLRDFVVFTGSGGFRTWGDMVKGFAMGLDGIVLGTADLVAIGCVRDRNCESGCRSGISTIEPRMQILRDVELNTRQIVNYRAILQAQVMRAVAALGLKDIRDLRGRYDLLEWLVLDERVKKRRSAAKVSKVRPLALAPEISAPADCGVAAIVSNRFVPSAVMDLMLDRMANRGMDGVGIWKGGCYPRNMGENAFHVLIKGKLQAEVEEEIAAKNPSLSEVEIRRRARAEVLGLRRQIMGEIREKYFQGLEFEGRTGDPGL
ncbi:MAG TPA: glutamate synthase-related protein, partial [Thermodesulfobacteriota bacterium]|nr:glutamate synthase-related protein [Thermodesulfobacteriota bacterium]